MGLVRGVGAILVDGGRDRLLAHHQGNVDAFAPEHVRHRGAEGAAAEHSDVDAGRIQTVVDGVATALPEPPSQHAPPTVEAHRARAAHIRLLVHRVDAARLAGPGSSPGGGGEGSGGKACGASNRQRASRRQLDRRRRRRREEQEQQRGAAERQVGLHRLAILLRDSDFFYLYGVGRCSSHTNPHLAATGAGARHVPSAEVLVGRVRLARQSGRTLDGADEMRRTAIKLRSPDGCVLC